MRKSILMMCLIAAIGIGTVQAGLNPFGTSWIPTPGIASDANPMIDPVTGNPVQAWYTIGYMGYEEIPTTFAQCMDMTHDYSLYADGKMDTFYSAYMYWKAGKIDGGTRPRLHFSNGGFQIMSPSSHRGAAVWSFIAPQDGMYEISGNVWVNNTNDAQQNVAGDHPEYLDPNHPVNAYVTVEVFSLTDTGNTTYTNIATYRGPDGYLVIPATEVVMKAGNMICISNIGGQGNQAGMNFGGGDVFLNTMNAGWLYGQQHPALVTVTLINRTVLPTFSPEAGNYAPPQSVTISCADAGATIRYTTNGSDPTESSTVYTAPLSLSQGTTLKARAWAAGKDPSSVATAVYAFPTATPTISPDGGSFGISKSVTISCAMPGAAIYYTLNGDTPTTGSTVYTGPIAINSDLTLKAIAIKSGYDPSAVKSATFTFPTSFNQPTNIPYGTATVNGDLSDWNDATWIPLDQLYWWGGYPNGSAWPTDIPAAPFVHPAPGAYYSVRWTENKVYVAIKVYDTTQMFGDEYEANIDAAEIMLHTTGNTGTTYGYNVSMADAQQYVIGPMFSDSNVAWTSLGANPLPVQAQFTAASKVSGSWIYYEAALTPFKYFDKTGSGSIVSPLSAGDVIGFDVTANSYDGSALKMLSENLMRWKSSDFAKLGLHVLEAAPVVNFPGDANHDGMVDVGDLGILAANYGGSGKTWEQGDFNGDGLVDVGDLGILAANYGTGVNGTVDFNADYAKAFGTTADDESDETAGGLCSGLGLPLIAGLLLMSLMLIRLED